MTSLATTDGVWFRWRFVRDAHELRDLSEWSAMRTLRSLGTRAIPQVITFSDSLGGHGPPYTLRDASHGETPRR